MIIEFVISLLEISKRVKIIKDVINNIEGNIVYLQSRIKQSKVI